MADKRKIRGEIPGVLNPVTVKGNNVVPNKLYPYFASRSVPGERKPDAFNFFAELTKEVR